MKYTIEELKTKKIAIKCSDKDEFMKLAVFLNLEDRFQGCYDKNNNCIEHYRSENGDFCSEDFYEEKSYTIITAKDFLEDREETEIAGTTEEIAKIKAECQSPHLISAQRTLNPDSILLEGDEARKYKILQKMTDWAKKYGGDFYFIQSEIYKKLKGLHFTFVATNLAIKEIGEEDLKFFFGIEETMTKRKAIIANESFQHKGKDFICKGMYEGDSAKVYFEEGNFVKNSWFFEDENEQVKIIKE